MVICVSFEVGLVFSMLAAFVFVVCSSLLFAVFSLSSPNIIASFVESTVLVLIVSTKLAAVSVGNDVIDSSISMPFIVGIPRWLPILA